jgi:hypothetical protein
MNLLCPFEPVLRHKSELRLAVRCHARVENVGMTELSGHVTVSPHAMRRWIAPEKIFNIPTGEIFSVFFKRSVA